MSIVKVSEISLLSCKIISIPYFLALISAFEHFSNEATITVTVATATVVEEIGRANLISYNLI